MQPQRQPTIAIAKANTMHKQMQRRNQMQQQEATAKATIKGNN